MQYSRRSFSLRRDKNGDLTIEFDLKNFSPKEVVRALLRFFVWFFTPVGLFFEQNAHKKQWLIATIGLGLGVALSIIVTQRPDGLQAFPQSAQFTTGGSLPQAIRIPAIDVYASVETREVRQLVSFQSRKIAIHDKRSAQIGSGGITLISDAWPSALFDKLAQLELGDLIFVLGVHQAEYQYSVIEVRNISTEHLPALLALHSNALFVYTAANPLETELHVVVARPL